MTSTLIRHRFTGDEFHLMIQSGIIEEGSRMQLIEGDVVEMAAMGGRHFSRVLRLNDRLTQRLGQRAFVSIQCPVRLSLYSEPEPDVAVLVRRDDEYQDRLPEPSEVLLIIEIADSTLRTDLEFKIDMYARAGIAESWLLALREDRLIVYRDPSPDGYRRVLTLGRGDSVAPLAFPDLALDVADMLGGPEPVRQSGA